MAFVAFLPLLVMASQGYHCARQAIIESEEQHLLSILESRKALLEAVAGEGRPPALEAVFRDRTGLRAHGHIYLIKPDGTYLHPPFDAPQLAGRKAEAPGAIRRGSAPKTLLYSDYRGRRVLGASTVVPSLKATLVAESNEAEAFEWLARLRIRATVTGFITLAAVLLIATVRSRSLSLPLRQLAAVARRIAAGDHDQRLAALEGTEAREVAQAFNKMMDELEASHRRLVRSASLASVGELSSRIVHEMRNPLSSVKINVQALRRKVAGDPAYSELADIAHGQVERLERMLSDLLNYGRPVELTLAPVRFADLTRDVLVLVAKQAEQKRVVVDVNDRLGESAFSADAEQVKRALTNLLTNAIEAVPEGGRVWISAEPTDGEGGRVRIQVADNGPGVPESHREKLFRPFFTTRGTGTGLGLANVKKIADLHGGSVTVGSRLEGGAVFVLELPTGGPRA
jgi:two-component system sensor histidine kinase AtoS